MKYANAFKLNVGILGADVFRIDDIILKFYLPGVATTMCGLSASSLP